MDRDRLKTIFNNIDLIIFDIDGVLVDVSTSYRKAIKKTAEYFNAGEITKNDIQLLKDEGGFNNDWDLTYELLKRRGISIPMNDVITRFQSYYWSNNGDGLILNEKWLLNKDILDKLSKVYRLAIFTGRPKIEANFVLKKNTASNYFSPVIAMEDVTNGKPDPEGINTICNSLDIGFEKVCYLGDTLDDINCAKSARVVPIGVIPPEINYDITTRFYKVGAFGVLNSVNDLIYYLNKTY